MKALTLWEPWASLMAIDAKRVETRGWTTKYRGEIAIHAAMVKPTQLGRSSLHRDFIDQYEQVQKETPFKLAPGCVLCIAELYAVELTSVVRGDLSAREVAFGNYDDGRYAWFFRNLRRLPTPISVKGNRMLWNWKGI